MTAPTQPPTEGVKIAPRRTRAAGNGIPVPTWGCTRCDSRWNGLKTAHCAACCHSRAGECQIGPDQLGVNLDDMSDQVRHPLARAMVLCPQFEVLNSVVGFVAINMMNRLFWPQWSTKVFGHCQPVAVGVPLGVRVRTVSANPDPGIAIGRNDRDRLTPRLLKAPPSVYSGGASGAVSPARRGNPAAVRVLAGLGCGLSWPTRRSAPSLTIGPRRKRHAASIAGSLQCHPRPRLPASRTAGFLPVVPRPVGGSTLDAFARRIGVLHKQNHTTFTTVSTFDKHRSGSHPNSTRHCVPPAEVGLVDAGRAYPCWAQAGTYEREGDQ